MLELSQVTAGYGAFTALWDVSLRVNQGEAVAVVGPNGAGKTTLLRAVSGLIAPRAGRVTFEGAELAGKPAYEIVAHGIAHVPEGRRLFPQLTVAENLKMGAFLPAARGHFHESLERVFTLFPVLAERSAQRAGSLSGGEQQMLAIGRALMAAPRLVLADEMSQGLAPVIVQEVYRRLLEVNRRGVTILLVEQNARLAFTLAHVVYVMEQGRVVLEGPAAEVAASEHVQRAYLGVG